MPEIRDDSPDPAVIEAAAARVWARLAEAAASSSHEHIRGCADFQALIPDYRAGRLPEARATLLKDHLHECVACRRVYEGRVVVMPAARPVAPRQLHGALGCRCRRGCRRRTLRLGRPRSVRQAATAAPSFRPLNGTLYEVSAAGIRPLVAGQDLPDGVEIRTAKDSDAMLQLHDGSRSRAARALRVLHHPDRERSHHSPRPRQHHRAGRQAPLADTSMSPPPIAAWPSPGPCSA